MTAPMTVGLVVHPDREMAREISGALRTAAEADGYRVVEVPTEAHEELGVVVSIGGDGTFLRAARIAAQAGCPVLGVKVGRMGFLTEVEPDGAEGLLRDVFDGSALLQPRTAVTAEIILPSGAAPSRWALNEVIVEKSVRHRVLRLAVEVDGEPITTFSGDGVIVATPTGSTAYSFSAGGPIVTPTVECLVLTPVAAHMVFDRSFVLAPDQVVRLEVRGDEPGVLSTDGQDPVGLPVGTEVVVRRAPEPAVVVRQADAESFLTRVREKFELPRGRS